MRLELGMTLQATGPEVTDAEIEAVCAALHEKGWVLARDLSVTLGVSDRHLRVCAEHSDGRIISGQKGYRIFDRTTPLEDADRAASWLESQAKRMMGRALSIRKRYHRFARDQQTEAP